MTLLCCKKTISFDKAACLKSTRHIQTLFDISFEETALFFEAANPFVNDSSGDLLTRWKSRFPLMEPENASGLKPTIGILSCGFVNKLKKKKIKSDIYCNLKSMLNPQTNVYIPLNGVYQNQKGSKMNQKRRPRLLIPVNKPSLHQRFLKIAENTNSNQSTPNLLIFKRKFGGILSDFKKLHLKNDNMPPPLNSSNAKKLHMNRSHTSMHVVNVHVKPKVSATTLKNIRKSSGSKNRLYRNINDRLKKIDTNNFKEIDATIGDYIVPQMKYQNFKFTTYSRKLPSCALPQSFNKRLKEINQGKVDVVSETIQVKGISYRIP